MTPQQAKELLPIITAFANGEIIEVLNREKKWQIVENVSFYLEPDLYRIKPKTKKCRVALFAGKEWANPWTGTANQKQFKEFEQSPYFIKWLTEEIEYPEKI